MEGAPGHTQESRVSLSGGDGVRDAVKADNIHYKHTVTGSHRLGVYYISETVNALRELFI